MSRLRQTASRRSLCEPEIVTHWPTVFAVGGLTLVFLVVPLVVCCAFQTSSTPEQPILTQAAVRQVQPPLTDDDEEEWVTPVPMAKPEPAVEVVRYIEAATPPPVGPAPAQPAMSAKEQVVAAEPTPLVPAQPIPEIYYGSASGDFVQATVTYIKQGFSVMHEVPYAAPWPARQRHDYFVRTRVLAVDEVNTTADSRCYPQRDAVLLALRKLSGQDLGTESQPWHDYLRKEWLGIE